MWLKKVLAFTKRDFLIWKSYRLSFFTNIAFVFIQAATFYYISGLFNGRAIRLDEFEGQYISFCFIGIVFNGYLLAALENLSLKIMEEQLIGTLEALLVIPIGYSLLAISLVMWDFLFGGIVVLIYFFCGAILLHFQLGILQFLSLVIVLVLSIISLSSLGILSAGFIIYFKKCALLTLVFGVVAGFLSGVYFPAKAFPVFLQEAAKFIPLTYILHACRLILLKGYHIGMLRDDISALCFFCVILFPLSIAVFNLTIKKAIRDGVLSQY
jgi:ABC-2 type transport system permease protein